MKVFNFAVRRVKVVNEILRLPKDTVWNSTSCDVLFLSSDANRADFSGGVAIDRVLDPLNQIFASQGYSTLTVALPGSLLTGKLTSARALSLNKSALWYQLMRSLTFRHIFDLPRKPEQTEIFRRLLRKLRPKLVIVLNASAGLCQAAFERKVPVAEVLHARGYGEPYNEEWRSQERLHLPDAIIGYDDSSERAFSGFIPYLRVPFYRFPFEMELAGRFLKSNPPPKALRAASSCRVILFTCGYDPLRPEWPGGLPEKLIEFVQSRDDLFLLVRIHPVMRTERRYRAAQQTLVNMVGAIRNADIEWASKAPIYAVLRFADLHITWESLTAYEAADLGLATYYLQDWRPKRPRQNSDLVERGLIHFIEPTLEVFEKLASETNKYPVEGVSDSDISAKELIEFCDSARLQKEIAESSFTGFRWRHFLRRKLSDFFA